MESIAALDEKVLVLNRVYAAVRIISARRAFCLLCKRIAEVISVEDGHYANYDIESWAELGRLQREAAPDGEADHWTWIRTPRCDIAVPRIIRLLGYDRMPRQQVKLNRRNIYARDQNKCQYCGKVFCTRELTIDHVTPRVQGGDNSWENLVCACLRCNTRKGGRTPDQAHMRLIRSPIRPKRNPAISIRLGQAKYESWKTFLDDAYWTVELRD